MTIVMNRAMDQLPRHPFIEDESVKPSFYCEVCDRYYSFRYMDRHHRTYKHRHNLLMKENVPRLHPSEVNDVLNE